MLNKEESVEKTLNDSRCRIVRPTELTKKHDNIEEEKKNADEPEELPFYDEPEELSRYDDPDVGEDTDNTNVEALEPVFAL